MIFGYVYESGTRSINEDGILFRCSQLRRGELYMACIFDGMGGMDAGEEAVYECITLFDRFYDETIIPLFSEQEGDVFTLITNIKSKGFSLYRKVNRLLFDIMRTKKKSMGTTASMIIGYRNFYFLFHIGDTRIYCIKSFFGRTFFHQLTKDHGVKNVLTKCLGLNMEWKPDFKFGYSVLDAILLCSDGFYHLYNQKIWEDSMIPKRMKDSKKINKRLLELAKYNLKNGESDNMSALYIVRKN